MTFDINTVKYTFDCDGINTSYQIWVECVLIDHYSNKYQITLYVHSGILITRSIEFDSGYPPSHSEIRNFLVQHYYLGDDVS